MNSFKIGVCVPTRDMWKPHFGQSLACASMAFWTLMPEGMAGVIGIYNQMSCSIIHNGRNNMVLAALKDDCTHILFLDDDMEIPLETIANLYLRRKDIVAANCTTKEIPAKPTAITLDNQIMLTRDTSTGLEECASVGAAVMMIKAEVFKKIEMPWFDFEWVNEPRPYDPDKSVEDNKMKVVGEDVYFCRKARKAGYKVWIDHDLSKGVRHIGDWPYGHKFVPGHSDAGIKEEDLKMGNAA